MQALERIGDILDAPILLLADKIGADHQAVKLILSLVAGYPLVAFYCTFLIGIPVIFKKLYFILTGVALLLFNYGVSTGHSFAAIFFTYAVLQILGGTRASVTLVFSYAMGYLLLGYYYTQNEAEYSFTWTIPQCVLTLRLIAVAFDVYDGHQLRLAKIKAKKQDGDGVTDSNQSKDSAKTLNGQIQELSKNHDALDRPPTLLTMLAHSYFPASCMVGPQIPVKKFEDFLASKQSLMHLSWYHALVNRFLLGLVYLAMFQLGSQYWPVSYLTSVEFLESPSFWHKANAVMLVGRFQTCKYLATWLLSEGGCILSGITYDAPKKDFYSITNVDVWRFETTPTFGGIIKSFNLTTNAWAAKYIFKRCKGLGSKFASHFITLFFLALWHGWHSGYYYTFLTEFLIMRAEFEVFPRIDALRMKNKSLDNILSALDIPLKVIGRIYTLYMWSYCLIPFILFSYETWIPASYAVYFIGHLIYVPLAILAPFLPRPKIAEKTQ